MDHEESLDVIEIDAASNNGVDEMRDLRDSVKYPPQYGKYRVYIIDEVHMLSTSAFNALLKTLEEAGYKGMFAIEREGGDNRVADIALAAKRMLAAG